MEWIGIAGLVITLVIGIAGLVIGLRSGHRIVDDLHRIVDDLHRAFDKRIEADTKFPPPEMTATLGVRREKKPVARFNLLRWLYLKVKDR